MSQQFLKLGVINHILFWRLESMDNILYLIFVLPGFIVFAISKNYLKGFGRKEDTFEKLMCCIVFDVIILISLVYLLNTNGIINGIKRINPAFNGIRSLESFKIYFFKDITMICLLIVAVILTAIGISLLVIIVNFLYQILRNKINKYLIYKHKDIWMENFVKVIDSLPVEIYNADNALVTFGFITETSVLIDDNIEFKIVEQDTFQNCKESGILKQNFTYYNHSKGLKIIVYEKQSQEFIEDLITDSKGENDNAKRKKG